MLRPIVLQKPACLTIMQLAAVLPFPEAHRNSPRGGHEVGQQRVICGVAAGDHERCAAALPVRSQNRFGDRVRASDSYGGSA